MAAKTYAEIEKDLPTIVKAELAKSDDMHRQLFAEEFGKKRRTLFHSYGFLILCSAHRWYITGSPWMTIIQWFTLLAGVGVIWVFIDLFLIPGMRRERNAEIAKSILAEYKIISSDNNYRAPAAPAPTVINVHNSQG